jgi:hypothetical protein
MHLSECCREEVSQASLHSEFIAVYITLAIVLTVMLLMEAASG